jgi:exonuclease VII small subunit
VAWDEQRTSYEKQIDELQQIIASISGDKGMTGSVAA